MKTKSYSSIHNMLVNEDLYPGALVVRYGNKYYPSLRSAANAEGVSPGTIKRNCKVYSREELRARIVSEIRV